MLSQIVRPLVETQIRFLAGSQNTRSTLIETMIRWLGYLGVRAEITELTKEGTQVKVCLKVAQPDNCKPEDWQKIIDSLATGEESYSNVFEKMTGNQQIKIARTLAYILQAGESNRQPRWEEAEEQLKELKIDENLLLMIKSALKIPQSPEIIEKTDGDVAAYIFPLAVQLSWLDHKVTTRENEALTDLLKVMENYKAQ